MATEPDSHPVRANMADDPVHYRWGSYQANGLGQADSLLTPHGMYMELAQDEAGRLAAFLGLLSDLQMYVVGH